MRIISQDGKYDIPYKQTCIACINQQGENVIFSYGIIDGLLLAKYSTPKKSLKVIEMLHDRYLSKMKLNGGYDVTNGCYVQPNYWVLPKVFKFPQDDEVEADNEVDNETNT